jgi:hypothetical protein
MCSANSPAVPRHLTGLPPVRIHRHRPRDESVTKKKAKTLAEEKAKYPFGYDADLVVTAKVCRQRSITLASEAGAKHWQPLEYGSSGRAPGHRPPPPAARTDPCLINSGHRD